MKKFKITISIFLGILVILIIFYFLFFYNFGKNTINNKNNSNNIINNINKNNIENSVNNIGNTDIVVDNSPVVKEVINEESLMRMAMLFAERFGSYSSHSNYENIDDLKIFMSQKMQVWADDYIKTLRAKQTSLDNFYGITTKALTKKINTYNDETGKGEVFVSTKRKEMNEDKETNFYQDIIISFIKEGGVWKVDNAEWQKKK